MNSSKMPVAALLGILLLTGCDATKELLDPDYKYAEPYFGKWNLQGITYYELYAPSGQEPTRSNEKEYQEVSGWIDFTKDEDTDDLYYRGSYSVTYTAVGVFNEESAASAEHAFKWSPEEDKNIYIQLDGEGKILGAGLSVEFVYPQEASEGKMVFYLSRQGANDTYAVTEFSWTK